MRNYLKYISTPRTPKIIYSKHKMLNPPIKVCKTCKKSPRFTQRTECLVCIQKKQKNLATAKKTKEKERIQVRKVKATDKKRFSRSKLTDEADRVWSIYIRKRDAGNPCITCNTPWTETAQAWHFMSRRHLSTRWIEKNWHGQCVACNNWWAWEQFKHWQAIDTLYGLWTAEQVMRLANDTSKTTDEEILGYIRIYYTLLSNFWLSNEDIGIKKYYLTL